MPCQCATTANVADAESVQGACDCTDASTERCACESSPMPSDHEMSLERVVMELDKRVRRLESSSTTARS